MPALYSNVQEHPATVRQACVEYQSNPEMWVSCDLPPLAVLTQFRGALVNNTITDQCLYEVQIERTQHIR